MEALGSVDSGSFHQSDQKDIINISGGGTKILTTSTDGTVCLFDSDTLILTADIFVSKRTGQAAPASLPTDLWVRLWPVV